jgi:hypothetical protein
MPALTDKQMDEFFDACETGDFGYVEKILDAFPAARDLVSALGQTPLFHAAMYAQEHIVKLLLDKGADMSHRDPHGFTAFEQAGLQNFSSICDLFTSAAAKRAREEEHRAEEALRREAETAIIQYSTGLEAPLKLSGPLHLRK